MITDELLVGLRNEGDMYASGQINKAEMLNRMLLLLKEARDEHMNHLQELLEAKQAEIDLLK